jgi:hypothetical protein
MLFLSFYGCGKNWFRSFCMCKVNFVTLHPFILSASITVLSRDGVRLCRRLQPVHTEPMEPSESSLT